VYVREAYHLIHLRQQEFGPAASGTALCSCLHPFVQLFSLIQSLLTHPSQPALITLVNLQCGFVAANESFDLLSCHKRLLAIVVLYYAFVTFLFRCSFYCSPSMCNNMPLCSAIYTIWDL